MKNRIINAGFTLLEIIIALGIFFALMVGVMQAMVSTTNYVNFDETRNEVGLDTIKVQNAIIQDFANASWFYDYDSVTDKIRIATSGPYLNQRIPLFPLVGTDRKSISFIKLRTSLTVSSVPANDRYTHVSFRDSATTPIDLAEYKNATPTPFMIMNPNYTSDPALFVAAVWESFESGLSFDENQDPHLLRIYAYLLESNKRGTKSLVRKYINGYSGSTLPEYSTWTLDTELISDVIDVTFATFTEDTSLNRNQVRISIKLERTPSGPSGTARVQRTIDITTAMRSVSQD
jgi:hypothetical protein